MFILFFLKAINIQKCSHFLGRSIDPCTNVYSGGAAFFLDSYPFAPLTLLYYVLVEYDTLDVWTLHTGSNASAVLVTRASHLWPPAQSSAFWCTSMKIPNSTLQFCQTPRRRRPPPPRRRSAGASRLSWPPPNASLVLRVVPANSSLVAVRELLATGSPLLAPYALQLVL